MKKDVQKFKGNWESVVLKSEVLGNKEVTKEEIGTYELVINNIIPPTNSEFFHIQGKKLQINQNENPEFMVLCNWEVEEGENLCFHNKIFSMVDYLKYSSLDDMLYAYEFNLSPNILVPINPIYKFRRKVKK
jgi:hypothetical protein